MNRFILAALAALTTTAHAGVISCAGDAATCFPTEDQTALREIHFDSQGAGVTTATGSPLNASPTETYDIVFRSTETFNHASGFAQIVATDGALNYLEFGIEPDDQWGLEMFEFSLNRQNNIHATVSFDYMLTGSDTWTPSGSFAVGAGTQWFSVLADPETISDFRITSAQGFEVASFKHLRVDPDVLPPTQVAAPGNVALVAMGLAGLMLTRRRRA